MTEEPERLLFRRQVDALGFAMIYHVVTLDNELSDGAFRLYALLLKYARQSGGCWPGIERLADDLDISEPTVKRRVAELVKRGLITRERRYMRSSITWLEDLETIYGLQLKNDTFERPFEQLKNDTTEQLKNDTTEEQTENNKQHVGVVGSELGKKQQHAHNLLTDLGVDPTTARKLAGSCDPGDVAGWVAYAEKAQGLDNAAGLVVARLKAGEPAPAASTDRDKADRRRFIQGEFADVIQH